ncbi:deleted in malignant brain tumors 1 protein-like [Mobula hypostoma]|uniref:deleted in malignant brain tumors 1 protein-like n=1 Tax=Mobula hypostoma TaxID=723540 RepID=UPI002FC3235B
MLGFLEVLVGRTRNPWAGRGISPHRRKDRERRTQTQVFMRIGAGDFSATDKNNAAEKRARSPDGDGGSLPRNSTAKPNYAFLISGSPVDGQPEPAESVKLRLMNGNRTCAGRVEIYYKGKWGTVDHDLWDLQDATVVCRELGCGAALKAPGNAYFGKGSGPVLTTNIDCQGDETALRECKSNPWGDTGYLHNWDAGVFCEERKQLRLVNGSSRCAGRVEVYYRGNWGTVHHDFWDLQDATVVCMELGCGAALKAPLDAYFGKGFGPVLTTQVDCQGKETALRECKSYPWGDTGYAHNWDAGVICEGHSAARLVAGNDECSGRLEVQFDDKWGTVCDVGWDMDDANVVCNQLQCGSAVSVLGGAYYGEGKGHVWNKVLECQGTEHSLGECPVSSMTHHCNHTNDVSLNCSGKHGPKLVGGKNRCSGRVEIQHGDQWGTLCDEYFGLEDAAVICEQLKCGAVNSAPRSAYFGKGNGPVWNDNYRCLGRETRLADCPVSSLGHISCSHGNDASLICSDEVWSVRLTDGGSRCDGRVEIYEKGTWSRVQDKFWNINDANVVCQQMRCGKATSAYNSSRIRDSEQPVRVIDVQCEGSESHLRDCRKSMFKRYSSDTTEVSVLCSGHLQIRLSGSEDNCAGRLEIYYSGTWGTVCDDSWDMDDANVVCRQLACGFALEDKTPEYYGECTAPIWLDELRCSEYKQIRLVNGNNPCEGRVEIWYNGTWGTVCSSNFDAKSAEMICKQMKCGPLKYVYPGSYQYGKGNGPIWLDGIEYSSHESTLWQCALQPWGKHKCDHTDDLAVVCQDLPLRLFAGTDNCTGRLEMFFNNSWGTVCDDSWSFADSQVVCRQLGCGPPLWASDTSNVTQEAGVI